MASRPVDRRRLRGGFPERVRRVVRLAGPRRDVQRVCAAAVVARYGLYVKLGTRKSEEVVKRVRLLLEKNPGLYDESVKKAWRAETRRGKFNKCVRSVPAATCSSYTLLSR